MGRGGTYPSMAKVVIAVELRSEDDNLVPLDQVLKRVQDEYARVSSDTAVKRKLIECASTPASWGKGAAYKGAKRIKTRELCDQLSTIIDIDTLTKTLTAALEFRTKGKKCEDECCECIDALAEKLTDNAFFNRNLIDKQIPPLFVHFAGKVCKTDDANICKLLLTRAGELEAYRNDEDKKMALQHLVRLIDMSLPKVRSNTNLLNAVIDVVGDFAQRLWQIQECNYHRILLHAGRIETLLKATANAQWLYYGSRRNTSTDLLREASRFTSRRVFDQLFNAYASVDRRVCDELFELGGMNPSVLATLLASTKSMNRLTWQSDIDETQLFWSLAPVIVSAKRLCDEMNDGYPTFRRFHDQVKDGHKKIDDQLRDVVSQDLAWLVGQYLFTLEGEFLPPPVT